ncbi:MULTISPECIES: hypothetical protein [unclassified Aureimonas]|uniref:hypothetical protein n=1 Tax=unclassified Aureimonas TaxID=2615206 RepID=UPI000B03B9A3|nr:MULTISPECIES: hypothetical protein [unclassified Aureimonas]
MTDQFPDEHFESCVHHCIHAYRTVEPAVVVELVLSYADLIKSDMTVAGVNEDEIEVQVEGFLERVEAEMLRG